MITGNYNRLIDDTRFLRDYTIPSDNRELQLALDTDYTTLYYTIPSDNRELQQPENTIDLFYNYTIPSDNRELQLAIVGFGDF